MKLLLDRNLSLKLCERLADVFPGSSQPRLHHYRGRRDKKLRSETSGSRTDNQCADASLDCAVAKARCDRFSGHLSGLIETRLMMSFNLAA
jgi:hypothetical protein